MAGHRKWKDIRHKTRTGSSSTPMTHTERRKLIERPFLSQRIPGKSWGGVLISDTVPVAGQRAYDPNYNWDESYLRYGRGEDEVDE